MAYIEGKMKMTTMYMVGWHEKEGLHKDDQMTPIMFAWFVIEFLERLGREIDTVTFRRSRYGILFLK